MFHRSLEGSSPELMNLNKKSQELLPETVYATTYIFGDESYKIE